MAYGHINDYVRMAKELKIPAISLVDYNSLSGVAELLTNLKNTDIKPIIGITTKIIIDSQSYEISIISKNKNGWHNLIHLVSFARSEHNENIDSIGIENISIYKDNLIIISQVEIPEIRRIYGDNFIINNEPKVLYPSIKDAVYQTIIENAGKHTTTENAEASRINNSLEQEWSDKSYVFNQIEKYDIFDKPKIPKLIDNGVVVDDPDEYLRNLCRQGWVKHKIIKHQQSGIYDIYLNRIKEELDVISRAELSNYMLLIRDIVNKCREDNKSVNIRGSAVGSLVAYLTDISEIDPVLPDPTLPYDKNRSLIFERFINKGRIADGHIALPDIDIDIVPSYRDTLKQWLIDKYGSDHVANIATFLEIKGASAIKDVFRVLNRPFETANVITKCMVNEARVQDDLEDAKSDNPDYTIINYCIDELPEFQEFYNDFKYEIDMANKLCNTVRSEGQHAAGIVISSDPLTDFLPIKREKGENIVTLRMEDIEACGGVKFDLLNVRTLEIVDNIWKSIK